MPGAVLQQAHGLPLPHLISRSGHRSVGLSAGRITGLLRQLGGDREPMRESSIPEDGVVMFDGRWTISVFVGAEAVGAGSPRYAPRWSSRLGERAELLGGGRSRRGWKFPGIRSACSQYSFAAWLFINHLVLQMLYGVIQAVSDRELTATYFFGDVMQFLTHVRDNRLNGGWRMTGSPELP